MFQQNNRIIIKKNIKTQDLISQLIKKGYCAKTLKGLKEAKSRNNEEEERMRRSSSFKENPIIKR